LLRKKWRKTWYQGFNKNLKEPKNRLMKSQFRVQLMLVLMPKQETMKKKKRRKRRRKKRRKKKRKKKRKRKKRKKNQMLHLTRKLTKKIHIWMQIWTLMNSTSEWMTISQRRRKPFQPHYQLKKCLKWNPMVKTF